MASISREDKELIRQFENPKTMGLIDVPYSDKTLARRVKKLVELGLLHVVGTEATSGRPKKVYCAKKCKNPEHELMITKLISHWEADFIRGDDVDPEIRPDFQLRRFCGEWDTGKCNLNQTKGRLQYYLDSDAFPVFVCQSETRMRNILNIGHDFVLATYAEEAFRPSPKCWDCHFEEYAIRKIITTQVEKMAEEKAALNLTQEKQITKKTEDESV